MSSDIDGTAKSWLQLTDTIFPFTLTSLHLNWDVNTNLLFFEPMPHSFMETTVF